MKKPVVAIVIGLCLSCGDHAVPKPSAQLRLDYPTPEYNSLDLQLPFTFEENTMAKNSIDIKVNTDSTNIGLNINYPGLKGTIYLTYNKVDGNLTALLRDSQNLTQKHTIKADEIIEQKFIDDKKRVFGMFYEVGGNAASQSQFYVTDSIRHFLNGSLYFYAKPNYDSIYPAAVYLKNDIKHIMETLRWRE